jgi:hypothetical protein
VVEGCHALVVASNELRKFLSDLFANGLVMGSLFRCKPAVARNPFHGACLLGTS